jgi:YbbR domain-containing protein
MKGINWAWLRSFLGTPGSPANRDAVVFLFFLLLSFVFWFLNSLAKDIETEIRYPVKYINLPTDRVLVDDLPPKLNLYLKGPGYSILKLRLSGSRTPVMIDISSVNYRRVPGSRTLTYYIMTSGLVPRLTSQLRTDCQITSIKPDTLFFSFDQIISKSVPVTPDIEINTERQYFVKGSLVVDPDSVIITGPRNILDTISAIKTRFRKLTGLNETIKRNMVLVGSDQYTLSEKRVNVTIPVEQFTEAELLVPVRIVNLPDTIGIKIFPDAVTVKCFVAVTDYAKLKDRPFDVYIDLRKANLNSSQKITIEVRNVPTFVNSLRISPTEVDFIIERKSR